MVLNLPELLGISILAPILLAWFYRATMRQFAYGMIAGPAALLVSLLMEYLMLSYFTLLFIVLVLAPVIEESAKFVLTLRGSAKRGMMVGMGFAWIENVMYFLSFSAAFALVFVLREFSDPILHGTTTAIASDSWRTRGARRIIPIGIAIALHVAWNTFSIITLSYPYLVFAITIAYGAALYFIIKKGKKGSREPISA